ncbi:MAG TPA: sce7726 family protein [Vicinamibacterales bacterium]|nr:sce7726 family protein [Vicinamibacterales bacterium]
MVPGSIFIARKPSASRARDLEVRSLLRQYLHEVHHGTPTVIIEELGLCQGDVRVDVAAVNGELSGFEIKSPSDTLKRWPKQRRIYSRVVDQAWLVAPERALAAAQAPSWWGALAVFDQGDRLGLRLVRAGQLNPSPDALSIAKLLWRDEALTLLKSAGAARGVQTKSRRIIWQRIVEAIAVDDLRAAVRTALKKRPERVANIQKRGR